VIDLIMSRLLKATDQYPIVTLQHFRETLSARYRSASTTTSYQDFLAGGRQ
jgi:hypothetical protein